MEKILGIDSNFLGAPTLRATWRNSRVAILPIPFEQTVSYGKGASRGPAAILKASSYVEFYDEETGRDVMRDVGIATLPPLRTGGKKGPPALGMIEKRAAGIARSGKFLFSLGGEHTITQALVRAHLPLYPGLSVLQIDAHSDLRESYQGTLFSHACVMARICEFLDPRRIVQVGIRAQCEEEAAFIRQKKITTLYAHQVRRSRPGAWMDLAVSKLSRHVYVTFDVDGLDPSVMPSTGTPEPNGLTWDETMRFLKLVASKRTVVGCDVVEFAPLKGLHHADLAAAKLVSKMINYFVR
ncbi:MAG TPA: agmatinase [Bacteroidota bacterium]|nr:agmatinase [Bacteroidota bacterium]